MTSWHINTSLNEEINDNTMKKEKKFSFPPIRFREFGTINTSTAYVLNYNIMLLWFSSRMSYNKIFHLPIWRQSKNISWMSNIKRIYIFYSLYDRHHGIYYGVYKIYLSQWKVFSIIFEYMVYTTFYIHKITKIIKQNDREVTHWVERNLFLVDTRKKWR